MRYDGHELYHEKNISEVEYKHVEHEVDESLYYRCFAYKIKNGTVTKVEIGLLSCFL